MKQNSDKEKVDFDLHASEYDDVMKENLNFFTDENSYFAEYKVDIVKQVTGKTPLRILEFGCGIGRNLKFFKENFPHSEIFGCDISKKSLEYASAENPGIKFFMLGEESSGSYKNYFDIIFASCVFHHIHPKDRKQSIDSIDEMLTPNGELYIFEHNPFNPVTQRIVSTCKWDTDAILLKPSETVSLMKSAGLEIAEKKFTLYFPQSLQKLRFLEKYLGSIPMGGQYYVKGIKKG